MSKKNNLISLQELCFFGLSKNYIRQASKICGLNFRLHKFHITNSKILKLQKKLDTKLTGKLLKKRIYQFKTFLKHFKNTN